MQDLNVETIKNSPPERAPSVPTIQKRNERYAYFMGLATGAVLLASALLMAHHWTNFARRVLKSTHILLPFANDAVIDLPPSVSEELKRSPDAVIENIPVPLEPNKHDTMLVRPDPKLKFVLRPGVEVVTNVLATKRAFNFDAPYLHYKKGVVLPGPVQKYIRDHARLELSFSTDANGFRTTVPAVTSDKKVLMIGDSVAFGVGAGDADTVASRLQKLLGSEIQVVNAAVGGYTGRQAIEAAKALSEKEKFAALIYVACHNDFFVQDDWTKEGRELMEGLHALEARFDHHVIILLHTYMEYNLRDVFLDQGWAKTDIEKTDALRKELPRIARGFGFDYYDWSEMAAQYMKDQKTLFSRFALYVDHCHFSPAGAELAAENILPSLARLQKH